ncbi:MAG: hypothetical protein ACTSUK_07205 [Promethearchaeota archaeon]
MSRMIVKMEKEDELEQINTIADFLSNKKTPAIVRFAVKITANAIKKNLIDEIMGGPNNGF